MYLYGYAFSLLLIGAVAFLAEATVTHSDFGCTNPIQLGFVAKNQTAIAGLAKAEAETKASDVTHFGCTNPVLKDVGANNAVFTCDNDPDEVRRVSLSVTFSTQGSAAAPPTACRASTFQLLKAMQNSPQTKDMKDAMFMLSQRERKRNTLDLVSMATWKDEMLRTAGAAASPLALGVNIMLGANHTPIAVKNSPKCVSKHHGNIYDTGTRDFNVIVERQRLYTEGSLANQANLSEEDAATFVHSWLSGQLDLYQHAGSFHTDGHTGNILVHLEKDGTMSFVWNDFGKTTSFVGHESHQFCHTLAKVSKFFQNSTDLIRDVTSRLPILHCPPDGNDCCGKNDEVEDEDLKAHFLDLLDQLENSGAVDTVWHRLSGRRMGSRVGALEKTVRQQATEISDLKKEVSDLKKENLDLRAEIDKLREEIDQLKKMLKDCLKEVKNPQKGKKFKFRDLFSRKNGNDQEL